MVQFARLHASIGQMALVGCTNHEQLTTHNENSTPAVDVSPSQPSQLRLTGPYPRKGARAVLSEAVLVLSSRCRSSPCCSGSQEDASNSNPYVQKKNCKILDRSPLSSPPPPPQFQCCCVAVAATWPMDGDRERCSTSGRETKNTLFIFGVQLLTSTPFPPISMLIVRRWGANI